MSVPPTVRGLDDHHTEGTKLLRIKVVAGVNLARKDIFGASDPYVKLHLFKCRSGRTQGEIDSQQTRTIKKTLNPKWEEEFIFRVKPRENKLLLEVFDENRVTRDDFLGLVEIQLEHALIGVERPNRLPDSRDFILRQRSIRSRVRGHLRLYLAYMPDCDGEEERDEEEEMQQEETADSESSTSTVEPEQEAAEIEDETPEEPLPNNWEMRRDDQGRVFYVNHQIRTTQWERPTASGNNDLPPGWEERVDRNGRTYYVDHNSRRTAWQRPVLTNESDDISAQQRRQAATLFRQRHHISQEDTLSTGSFDDLSNSRPENPAISQLQMGGSPTPQTHVNRPPLHRSQTTTSSSAAASLPTTSDTVDEPLPPGWAISFTESGRSFYIDHNTKATSWEDPRKRSQRSQSITSLAPNSLDLNRASSNEDLTKNLGALPDGWEERIHTNGRIFYINHRNKATQWEDPRLQKLGGPAVKYSRDYKRKYDYFRSKLRKPSNVPNKIDIPVTRSNIFEDSYRCIMNVKNAEMLKTRLWVEFDGEHGLDYGGVSREFFYLLSKEMFNPYYGLFEYSAIDDYTLQINPMSGMVNPEHLHYFKFIGRVVGMAVYHGKLVDAYFIRPFYKLMLGHPIVLNDMESVEPEYHNSLKWILENDPECLELTFALDEDVYGETKQRELKPGGKEVPVTEENKKEYIDLVIRWRFSDRIKKQISAFMEGFNELVPQSLLTIFDANEIELLLAGLQDVDVNDWKKHTQYRGDYNANHPVIVNFWRAVYSFHNETRSRLLQFVTGTSRVPMNGFQELYGSNGPQLFTIEKWGTPKQLPRAHTCFNRVDLPPYPNYSELRQKLVIAIENAEGFEGVD